MAAALWRISTSPPPVAGAGAARLLSDLRAGVDLHGGLLRERAELARRHARVARIIGRLRRSRTGRALIALRATRAFRAVTYPLRPLTARFWRVLS
jgi:hypothetical protein